METILFRNFERLINLFKSYYVVWKRRGCGHRYIHRHEFKSYYVVWKQGLGKNHIFQQHRLNRTM